MKVFKIIILGTALVTSSATFVHLMPESQTTCQIASAAEPKHQIPAQVAAYPEPEGQTPAQVASYRIREEK